MPKQHRQTRIELILQTAGIVLFTLLFGAGALWAGMGAWNMYERMHGATIEMNAAKTQMRILEQQDVKTKAALEVLSTQEGVEGAIRERYGMAKPGEGVIQIVQQQSTSASPTAEKSGNIFVRLFHAIWPW